MKRALAGDVAPEERSRLEAACTRADGEIAIVEGDGVIFSWLTQRTE
ncbi:MULTISPECIES: hypothetical protein [unclassified Methanoculleus]|uniref:Uncharacterized protein n=1 Tax=Methanoculleus palmolei TaxID=72612 RepID=A0ABD8A8E5_9EURY|nr:hypothetical protein [Methanoculleus sp. UBA377]MDD2472719.1 hypothetical protein [Methanoculleus sp.]WOX55784.1 hypothetical protein R6Y95_00245 [Methanoculleus palmolei]